MRRIALCFCTLLVLTSCRAKPAEPTVFSTVEPTPAPVSTASSEPIWTPTPSLIPGAEETAVAGPVSSRSPTAFEPGRADWPPPVRTLPPPTLAEAKALVERANNAMAPFLGEGGVDCGREGWLLLETCRSTEDILAEMRAVFQGGVAEQFFESYRDLVFQEMDGRVYVRADSRDIIGHYYDMDLDSMGFIDDSYFIFSDHALSADGFGNGTPVEWEIGINEYDGEYKVYYYACHGHVEDGMELSLSGRPYGVGTSYGSPGWLGEPDRVEETVDDWGNRTRMEYYPGLSVELRDNYADGGEFDYNPWSLWVTGPGISTSQGVEVGDTLREVLSAYPQFDLWGADDYNGEEDVLVYSRWYPWARAEYAGDVMIFRLDESLRVKEIFFEFDCSN